MRKVFLFFLLPVNLSQYRGTVGMFNNTIASKRCIKPGICYRRKMQSCEFSLIIILFIFLHVFSILIRFLKKIVWQYMLMAQSNKNFLTSCFYWFLWSSYLYHIWLFPRLIHLGDTEKNPGPRKDSSQTPVISHWNLYSCT